MTLLFRLSESGIAMVMVVFIMLLLGSIITFMAFMAGINLSLTDNLYQQQQDFYAAEAALEYGLYQLEVVQADKTLGQLLEHLPAEHQLQALPGGNSSSVYLDPEEEFNPEENRLFLVAEGDSIQLRAGYRACLFTTMEEGIVAPVESDGDSFPALGWDQIALLPSPEREGNVLILGTELQESFYHQEGLKLDDQELVGTGILFVADDFELLSSTAGYNEEGLIIVAGGQVKLHPGSEFRGTIIAEQELIVKEGSHVRGNLISLEEVVMEGKLEEDLSYLQQSMINNYTIPAAFDCIIWEQVVD